MLILTKKILRLQLQAFGKRKCEWCFRWRKSRFKWKKVVDEYVLEQLESTEIYKNLEDKWIWRGEDNKLNLVRFAYNKIRNGVTQENDKLYEKF